VASVVLALIWLVSSLRVVASYRFGQ